MIILLHVSFMDTSGEPQTHAVECSLAFVFEVSEGSTPRHH